VWTHDYFVHERTYDGRALLLIAVLDEYSQEGLAIEMSRP